MKICVYAIAKNEAQHVAAFMEAAKPADGVFILDTGSTDDTVALAHKHGASVQSQSFDPWRFDAARNASLALVPENADICVCVDLDEVLQPGWRTAIEQAWQPGVTRCNYKYIWSRLPSGAPDVLYWADKIHAREGYKWRHPVHEVLVAEGAERIATADLVIEHFSDPQKPRGQYLPLLELAVQEDPEDPRNMHYLGREYITAGQPDKAERVLLHHLSMPRATWMPERAASLRYLACVAKLRKDEASRQQWLLRACAEAPGEREAWVELAQAYQDVENYSGALFASKQALAIKERPRTYLTQGYAWGEAPWSLGSVGALHIGAWQEALTMSKEALRLAPQEERLAKNMQLIREALVDPGSTHQRMLVAALAASQGPVLELGCGHYSTPLLHGYCAAASRMLHTVESDPTWAEVFLPLERGSHGFQVGPWKPEDLLGLLPVTEQWGVVFVNCAKEKRIPNIKALLPRARLIVVRDAGDPYYDYANSLPEVKWAVVDKSIAPWTMVISQDTHDSFSY